MVAEGTHDSPGSTIDRLIRVGTKYNATAPSVADGDDVFFAATPEGNMRVELYKDGTALSPPAAMPGASEVKTATAAFGNPSTTRATLLTPTSGKKVRIISIDILTYHATETTFSAYFGTGAAYTTNAGSEITEARLDKTIEMNHAKEYPDGAGPVGAADDVVSIITADDIAASARCTIAYREE